MPTRRGRAARSASCRRPRSPPRGSRSRTWSRRGRYPHQRWLRQWSARTTSGRRARRWRPPACRAARPAGGRALRRPAPAGLDRHGAGPGDRRSCCSTSPPPTWTWPTRSRCSTCSTELNRRDGRTVVMVLHDLNQACRYAARADRHAVGADLRRGPAGRRGRRRDGAGGLRGGCRGGLPIPSSVRRCACRTSTPRFCADQRAEACSREPPDQEAPCR